jgi:hypothetical protein
MILQSILVYLPAVLSGFLFIHLLWPERNLVSLFLKFFLGIGAGLGLFSFLYFILLLTVPGRIPFLSIQAVILIILIVIAFLRERNQTWNFKFHSSRNSSFLSSLLLLSFLAALLITLASFVNFSIRRDQGAFDAWMIYNRAARFIFRDTEHWQAALSPDLYWGFHADYPLLIPLNAAWAWEALGTESVRAPLIQSGLFLFGAIGLMFAALAKIKSLGQASLAAIILMSISGFVRSGSGQTADVPLAFYLLASNILLYLAIRQDDKILLALSGLMNGLAGWTKNEGLLALAVGAAALLLFSLKQKSLKTFLYYAAGLLFPALVIVYFKAALAPPSDLFAGSLSDNLAKILDSSRYVLIFKAVWMEILSFGGWPISMILALIVYGLFAGFKVRGESAHGFWLVLAIMSFQMLGYISVYLITPHDLAWQIGTSFDRTVMQVFPSFLFLFFSCISEPETFSFNGGRHASGN